MYWRIFSWIKEMFHFANNLSLVLCSTIFLRWETLTIYNLCLNKKSLTCSKYFLYQTSLSLSLSLSISLSLYLSLSLSLSLYLFLTLSLSISFLLSLSLSLSLSYSLSLFLSYSLLLSKHSICNKRCSWDQRKPKLPSNVLEEKEKRKKIFAKEEEKSPE
jgi:hypothetical protein